MKSHDHPPFPMKFCCLTRLGSRLCSALLPCSKHVSNWVFFKTGNLGHVHQQNPGESSEGTETWWTTLSTVFPYISVWWFGTLEHEYYFSIYILGISSSQLTCIFFRGVEPTNQLGYKWAIFNCHAGVSIKWGYPKWMVYFLESPVKMDENWGYPHFRKPPCFMKLGRYLVAHPRNLKWIITPVISGFSCRVDPLKKLGWTNPLTIRG